MRTVATSAWKQQRKQIQDSMEKLKESPIFGPLFSEEGRRKAGSWREELNTRWNNLQLSTSDKVYYPILAANIAVFLAWRIPALSGVMMKYFACNPASKSKCLPMILSVFSHYGPFHLFANMYVLHSFR